MTLACIVLATLTTTAVDLMMPTMGGLEATEQLMQRLPETRVLILTSFGSADELQRALDAGAAGALLKSTPNRELLKAIRRRLAQASAQVLNSPNP